MPRPRSLVGPLLLALSLGLIGGALVASPAAAVPDAKIWGVAVDGKGRAILDVVVKAVDGSGTTVATDLSYDAPDSDVAPRQGYFGLFPGGKGSFEVSLKKKGYESVTFSTVKVAKGRRVVGLGDVQMLRSTSTSGADGQARAGDKAKVRVTVDAGKVRPTGKVKVSKGSKVLGSATLKASNKGTVIVTLGKMSKGTYGLTATYAGNALLADSTSKKFTLTVKPSRKNSQLPNARPFLG